MSDDYEPAITDTATGAESGAESAPIVVREPEAAGPVGDDPSQPPGAEPRGQRVISDKVREMFKVIAAKAAAADGVADDLVPMEHEEPATAPAAVATPAPVAPPVAAAPRLPTAPVLSPAPPAVDVGRAAMEQAKALQDQRDQQQNARETALAAREKLLPDRTALAERPAEALVSWLKDIHGISTDDDMKVVLTDIVTELSEIGLGVKLPPEVKNGLEARRALRTAKAYGDDVKRQREAMLAERTERDKQDAAARDKQDAASREQQAIRQVNELVATTRDTHKFLHDADVTGGAEAGAIVVEVIREQLRRGQQADWKAATDFANNYYRTQAETTVKTAAHLQSLLLPTPAAPAAAAKPATAPGGAPGPAPKPQATPTPTEAAVNDSDEPVMDRRDRRARDLRAVARKHKVLGTSAT